jgi:hypothetical protein
MSRARPRSAASITRRRRPWRSIAAPAASENSRLGSNPAAVSNPICVAFADSTRTAVIGMANSDT